MDDAGEDDPDPALGGERVLDEQDDERGEEEDGAGDDGLEEEEGAATVVLGDQVPAGVKDRGDEDEG